jgi:hypothetical protein
MAMAAAAVVAVTVIGWRNSSHKIVQVPVSDEPTRYEYDLPQSVMDKLPSNPESETQEAYLNRMQRAEAALDDRFSQDW